MKQLLLASTAAAVVATGANAGGHISEVKIGIALGFTGPLESLAPPMENGAKLAIDEINASGLFVDGATISSVSGDSTCVDAAAAVTAAERLITVEGINGLVGAMCSGATGAILTNVSIPNGMVQISPSATSPGLTTLEDNGLFYRFAPSDARQGELISEILNEKGIGSIALTYDNSDYGKGLADAIQSAFEASGGSVTLSAAHESAKADYSAEVGALASAGGDMLVVAGYADGGGAGVIQSALDSGAFDTFFLPDGMISDTLTEAFGGDLEGAIGTRPAAAGPGRDMFGQMAEAAGFDGNSSFAGEAYDAAAVMLLAMHKANSIEPGDYNAEILGIANAPGEEIGVGELARAIELINEGVDINYEGASSVELIGPGEAGGRYEELMIEGGDFKTIQFR